MKDLDAFERALIRELALTGLFSRPHIAAIVGVDRWTVHRFTTDLPVTRTGVRSDRVRRAIEMHRQGARNKDICRELGLSPPHLSEAIRKHRNRSLNYGRR